LAGCEGDDGKDGAAGTDGTDGAPGAPGPVGPAGPPGPVPGIEKPLESCAVCHGDNSVAEVEAAHALVGQVAVSNVATAVVGADLTLTFNVKVDKVNATDFNAVTIGRDGAQTAYRFDGLVRDTLSTDGDGVGADVATPVTLTGGTDGNYTLTIAGGAIYTADSRYFIRIQNPAGTRALVIDDYPAAPYVDVVDSGACANCHGDNSIGFHYDYPVKAENCTVCHSASNTDYPRYINLGHGIHNSHNMPGGEFQLRDTAGGPVEDPYSVTYPTYMTNCSVCHGTGAGLDAANAMPASYEGCLSCHGSMEGFGFPAGNFHLNADETVVCTNCHQAPLLPATVADFHNGLETERVGIIWDGEDQSVAVGKRFTWKIDSIVDDGTNLKISWSATFDGNPINPCNATASATAPIIFPYAPNTAGEGTAGMLRSYVQGDDYVLGKASAPGQATTTNLTTTNTVCAGTVATTTIPVEAGVPAGTRGVVALVGKWQVPVPDGFANSLHAADWPYPLQFVRVPTPTEEWIVGSSGIVPKASQRREIADTGACLKCHVGSLYQHGNTRVDNVQMCAICHNSASSDQNNRVSMGVDKTEAYDGLVGQTYELKSWLHALHTAGGQEKPLLIYRTRGIFAWAPEGLTPPNWPTGPTNCTNTGTGPGHVVFGAADPTANVACQTHNLHHVTYPRAANDCAACHKDGFDTMVDQTKGVATTLDVGGTTDYKIQTDDVLQGANTAACTSCHQGAPSVGHANQNGWVPTTFPNGRQTIIDAAK
jgi:OmcA/MtrC family decaheme c-type cytochrome